MYVLLSDIRTVGVFALASVVDLMPKHEWDWLEPAMDAHHKSC